MTEGQIFVAISMKTVRVEEKNGGWLGCPCAEMPGIGREHPRPAHRFARNQGLSRDRPVSENPKLQRDRAVLDQVKAIGWFAGAENHLVLLELLNRSTLGQKIEMMGFHVR